MYKDYKNLVLKLIENKKYPVLFDHVLIYIEYKLIDASHTFGNFNDSIKPQMTTVKDNYDTPEILFDKENEHFKLVYFSRGPERNSYCMYKSNCLEIKRSPKHLLCIKLDRNVVDNFLNIESKTFEEEIYTFITYINFNLQKIRKLINVDFLTSTRLVPLSLRLCVSKYVEKSINTSFQLVSHEIYFGPSSESLLESRVIRGKLSYCSSKDIILSLKDDIAFQNIDYRYNPYNTYYSTKWKTVLPLAFNPLENPIIT